MIEKSFYFKIQFQIGKGNFFKNVRIFYFTSSKIEVEGGSILGRENSTIKNGRQDGVYGTSGTNVARFPGKVPKKKIQ